MMPDPYGRYANLLGCHPHLKSTIVNTPTIYNQNGALILLSDFSTKLPNQTVVFATVKLRLYVLFSLLLPHNFLHVTLYLYFSWEIFPQSEEKKTASGFKFCPGKENGSHIYQLVLHEMSLLPNHTPTYNITLPTDITNNNTIPPLPGDKGKKCVLPDFDTNEEDTNPKKNGLPQNSLTLKCPVLMCCSSVLLLLSVLFFL